MCKPAPRVETLTWQDCWLYFSITNAKEAVGFMGLYQSALASSFSYEGANKLVI